MFEVAISLNSKEASSRLLALLEEQKFDYQIVRGIRDPEGFRELEVKVLYPSIFWVTITPLYEKKFKTASLFHVHGLESKFEQQGATYELAPQLARQHMENLLFKFIYVGERPWNFEKGSFFSRVEPEKVAARQKWEKFLGEEL
ncbi:MAG: hypothetical protein HXS41_11200 [Theionarchaea archaeon]|nr:hypothetical protein [Theionarchaea archaeon]MBU7000846.1 hypothetical protein [Theionarchaea archaeon]MBU7021613.1 hypothetical protein [Theionarchaea archaeon]MBU7034924.1 hypothetical protein [Theionarchaea archaeon]MBU7039400.1 hypothetical protein [Theionarchaea archaeon]